MRVPMRMLASLACSGHPSSLMSQDQLQFSGPCRGRERGRRANLLRITAAWALGLEAPGRTRKDLTCPSLGVLLAPGWPFAAGLSFPVDGQRRRCAGPGLKPVALPFSSFFSVVVFLSGQHLRLHLLAQASARPNTAPFWLLCLSRPLLGSELSSFPDADQMDDLLSLT